MNEGVFPDPTINLPHVIVQSKKPGNELPFHPLVRDVLPFLPDPEDAVPGVDKVVVSKADVTKELARVQGVVEVEIPYS